MNISEFINESNIKMNVTQIPARPDGSDFDGYHYLVTLTRGKEKMTVCYSMGYGHAQFDKHSIRRAETLGASFSKYTFDRLYGQDKIAYAERCGVKVIAPVPELADVLDNLASDAAGYENARSFEDWASDYGYDTDSRKAERIYSEIKKQVSELRRLLGADYEKVLFEIERL